MKFIDLLRMSVSSLAQKASYIFNSFRGNHWNCIHCGYDFPRAGSYKIDHGTD